MSTHKYYVRISTEDEDKFNEYLDRNGIRGCVFSRHLDSTGCSSIYYLTLTYNQASSIILSFRLVGIMDLDKAEKTIDFINN